MDHSDPFDLARFVEAQAGGVYERALAELIEGKKRTHWMWFIFPQHRELGRSETAKYFGLGGVAEAVAYAAHPLLGQRLRDCCAALLPHLEAGRSAVSILGPVDALKLASSMEIFSQAVPGDPSFASVREQLHP